MDDDRTRLRRMPERGAHDHETIDAILDEGVVAHVAFADGEGRPAVVPTGYVRDGDRLLLHGSKAGRLMRALASGQDVSVAVTLLDGLVLARSGFNHSMNYRSVVVYGRARPVADGLKAAALRAYMDRLLPGRWDTLRPVSAQELAATEVVEIPLAQASAKSRAKGVDDDPKDLGWPVWAGVVPLRVARGPAIPDTGVVAPVPQSLVRWAPDHR